ncbi:helix-turn-helix transcriptional regulator [Halomarina oriensis]|uniref:MarR family transcriptional regulator n=1 Tax=Halomarina oriensis TaxID=671145 RepID=A0A6B0GDS9_9EURY|nr:hypothetical protein [Halomarina oriensis]MWG33086.1 hypothetical protein [Halomarina oriensis]
MPARSSGLLGLLSFRAPVLRALSTGVVGKRELVSNLDVSRSTVDRAVRELATRGFVEPVDGGYRATLSGQVVLDALDRFEAATTGVDEAADVLSVLPREAPFPPSLFAGAEVVRPSPVAPDRPAETNRELLSWADTVRGLVSAVSERYVDTYQEAIETGTSVELVFPSSVFERLLSRYDLVGDPVFGLDRVSVRETDERVPCSVKLHERGDEQVASLTVYGSDGLRGVVTNDSPEAVSWTAAYIDHHWQRADALPSP